MYHLVTSDLQNQAHVFTQSDHKQKYRMQENQKTYINQTMVLKEKIKKQSLNCIPWEEIGPKLIWIAKFIITWSECTMKFD